MYYMCAREDDLPSSHLLWLSDLAHTCRLTASIYHVHKIPNMMWRWVIECQVKVSLWRSKCRWYFALYPSEMLSHADAWPHLENCEHVAGELLKTSHPANCRGSAYQRRSLDSETGNWGHECYGSLEGTVCDVTVFAWNSFIVRDQSHLTYFMKKKKERKKKKPKLSYNGWILVIRE